MGTVDRGGGSSGLAVAMSAAALVVARWPGALVVAGREVARAAVKTAAAARARGCGVAGRDGEMWSEAEQGVAGRAERGRAGGDRAGLGRGKAEARRGGDGGGAAVKTAVAESAAAGR